MDDQDEVEELEQDLSDASNVSIEDVERFLEESEKDGKDEDPKPPQDLSTIKVEEGDDDVKGRSVAELVERAKNLERALRISEEARVAASRQPTAPAKQEEEPVVISDADIVELMKTEPEKALQVMREQNARMIEDHVQRRIGPLATGSIGMAERDARARYADEFELFGPQIQQFANSMRDKSSLASAEGWDNVVAYVRGLEGNIQKLIDKRITKSTTRTLDAARQGQRRSAGVSGKPARTASAGSKDDGNDYGLDAVQKEVARNMKMSYKEYYQWMRLG